MAKTAANRSSVKPTPDYLSAYWCIATPDYAHPATRRTVRCDRHQRDYEAAMNRYSSAVWSYKHGNGPKPPRKEDFQASIKYSDPEIWGWIEPELFEQMQWVHRRDSSASSHLADLLNNRETPAPIAKTIRDYIAVHEETLDLLRQLLNLERL